MNGSPQAVRILYVGDDETDPERLAATADRFRVDVVSGGDAAVARVREQEYDCLVCEYDLAERSGVELASAVEEARPGLPVVLSPLEGSEAIAGEAVAAGVSEYVPGDEDCRSDRLAETVEAVIEDARSVPNRQQLLAAIDAAAEGIALLSSDGRYEYVNDAYAEMFGYESDELVGRHRDVVSPDDRSFEDVEATVRERGEIQREGDCVRADGTRARIQYTISTVSNGGFVCTSRDISERPRRQDELERQSSLLDSLFDQIPAHLYIKDREGRHQRVSRYFEERERVDEDTMSVAAYDRDHVIGKTDSEINDSEHGRRAYDDDMRVIETGEPILNREEYVPHDDAWNITSKVPWRGEDGTIRGLIGITQRITDQKRAEAELERKNERLSEFASLVSHDLRNPLQTARGRTEVLQQRYDDDSLAAIERAHERMETLIDDILTLALGTEAPVERERVALDALVDQCWDRLDGGDGSLVLDTDQTLCADRSRLTQLVENLFENAVDHGGTGVTVTVGELPEGGFYVEDDGPGIQPSDRKNVFEAGYSTTETGTGFGLRIVQQVAAEHGWTVELADGRDGGARFEIRDDSSTATRREA